MPKPPLIVLAAIAAAAAPMALWPASARSTPADTTGAPFTLGARRTGHGVVTAVENAGSYAYVTVDTDDGRVVVATLGSGAVIGDVVDLTLFARRDVFVSKRLHKTFAPLDFGVVTPRR